MEIDELIKRATNKNNTDKEWLQLESDMQTFLDEENPEEEKRKLVPLGWKESVTIICDEIRRKNSWATSTMMEVPFWRDDMTLEEYEEERAYFYKHLTDWKSQKYRPLWKQRKEK